MAFSTLVALSAASVLFSAPVEAGLYPKSSAVLSLTGRTYDKLIAQSNHTSIVEFYAPWCGHCKNLQPAYEKVAQNLKGLAKVAAIDCDEESNKPFCGSMGVQGFPTLKIIRPGKKPGRPTVEDYQGPRQAKAIVDAVVEKIPNHVKRVTDKSLNTWLKEGNETAKAVLFSDKSNISALLRSLAIDYLGSINFGQIRDKESESISTFGITKYPMFVVLPGGSKDAIIYEGELKKEAMSKFVSESSGLSPNPDPAPAAKKETSKKADKAKEKKFSKASASHKSEDASSEKLKATSIVLDEEPTQSPDPKVDSAKPVEVREEPPMIATLKNEADLQRECLSTHSKICILALLPTQSDPDALLPQEATQALLSLRDVHYKHAKRHAIFPFYAVGAENPLSQTIRDALSLKPVSEFEIIATNAKRSWVRKYPGSTYGLAEIDDWVDAIKMNEGKRDKLPDSLIKESVEEDEAAPAPEPEAVPEPKSEEIKDPEDPVEAPEVINAGPIVVEVLDEVDEKKEKEHIIDEL